MTTKERKLPPQRFRSPRGRREGDIVPAPLLSSSCVGQCEGCHTGSPHYNAADAMWTKVHKTLKELLDIIKQLGDCPVQQGHGERGLALSGGLVEKGRQLPDEIRREEALFLLPEGEQGWR